MKVLIKTCARCEEDHEVDFMEFKKNPVNEFTHWGMCPILEEPILMKIIFTEEGTDEDRDR